MLPQSALDNELHHYFITTQCENYDRCFPNDFTNLSNHGCASRTLFCNNRVIIDREIQNEENSKRTKQVKEKLCPEIPFSQLLGWEKQSKNFMGSHKYTTSQHLRIRLQYVKKITECEIKYTPWDLQVCLWHLCVCVCTCLECRKPKVHVIKCKHVSNPPQSSTVSAV